MAPSIDTSLVSAPRSGDAARLFCLGFVTLSLELALIRFLAGTVWNLGYFPNLVLLAVFVGMGCGFAFHSCVPDARSPRVARASPWLLLLLGALVVSLHPSMPGASQWMQRIGGELYFTSIPRDTHGARAPLFLLWFFGVFAIFACISQRTAKLFRRFTPLRAYTLDIGGSCAGIVAFTLVSFAELSAYLWFLLLAPFFVLALTEPGDRRRRWLSVVPLTLLSAISFRQDRSLLAVPGSRAPMEAHWSPYQKIELAPKTLSIFSNGVAHQGMHAPDELAGSYYEEPYRARSRHPELPPYKSVLVMGAGSGNDVMAALMNGADHVDAVEIDPVIADIGARVHPGHPYADPRVTVTIDDARAFMTKTDRRYDLIIFALTDSLVRVSSMTQLRLENYLFTVDAFERARKLLTPTGDVVMYNFYRTAWLPEKLRLGLRAALGTEPELLMEHDDFRMLRAGKLATSNPAAPFTDETVELPTDDWPFLYLRERAVPSTYLAIVGGLFAVVAALATGLIFFERRSSARSAPAPLSLRVAFLLMGAAFLLLETKSLVQFSLLFGTTWLNNSLVFFAILVLVLFANWFAALVRARWVVPLAFGLLLVACAMGFAFPIGRLLSVPSVAERFALASVLTFSPIFFANVIFSTVFRSVPVPEEVFGWNLIGATLGGALEYASMRVGYRALALVVALLYLGVFALVLLARGRAGAVTSSL
jgi:hypothetical protein